MMTRILERELLDELPPSDPEAVRSRRDLRRLNAWMGNARAIATALQETLDPMRSPRLVDIGAGDGMLMLKVARTLARRGFKPGKMFLVDRQQVGHAGLRYQFEALGWEMEFVHLDVFRWAAEASEPFEAIIANLFLHHFEAEPLKRLFSTLAGKTRTAIAMEPERSRRALTLARWVWLIGCNRVTRHDAWVSVRAGFTGRELSALWRGRLGNSAPPERNTWDLIERSIGMAGHLFLAQSKT